MDATPESPNQLALEKEKWDLAQQEKRKNKQEVVITGINIPFTNLVTFLVSLAIAAVPAGIIVAVLWAFLAGLIRGLLQ